MESRHKRICLFRQLVGARFLDAHLECPFGDFAAFNNFILTAAGNSIPLAGAENKLPRALTPFGARPFQQIEIPVGVDGFTEASSISSASDEDVKPTENKAPVASAAKEPVVESKEKEKEATTTTDSE